MDQSFQSLYTAWLMDGRGRDAAVEAEMSRRYRAVWVAGMGVDRKLVLLFVMISHQVAGFDLVREALQGDDRAVTNVGVAVAATLIGQGFDLGAGIQDDLAACLERCPEARSTIKGALADLNETH